jgi:1-acyl-sn-glycerol-3-phosphate acyltransferase
MSGAGYVKIDRSNRVSAFKSIDQVAAKMKNGVSVMIFPEGTRSEDGNVQPFKKGGFVMAVDTGAPIVPVILRGTRSIMTKGSWRIHPGDVTMSIEKPIDTTGYTRDTKEDLIKIVRRVICEVFEKETKFDTSA